MLDLAAESVEAGADEIQMDACATSKGVENADFRLKERGLRRPQVIADFVHRVHELTQARGVSLSIDIFGIVAEGVKADLENLGQDPALLARECDALAPMVYPSHYPKGFMGFDEPGDHPELVRVGVRRLLALIQRGHPGDRRSTPDRERFDRLARRRARKGATPCRRAHPGWMVWDPQDYTDKRSDPNAAPGRRADRQVTCTRSDSHGRQKPCHEHGHRNARSRPTNPTACAA
jgi:hypothetical protein